MLRLGELGVWDNRLRLYDPKTGTFTSPDPIGDLGGYWNWYPYAGNNPGNEIDSDGLSPANTHMAGPGLLFDPTDATNWTRSDFSAFADPLAGLNSPGYDPFAGTRIVPPAPLSAPTWLDTAIDSVWSDFTDTMGDA